MCAAARQSCSPTSCTHEVEQWPTNLSVADFCGEKVVERHMSRLGREPLYECITAASKTRDNKAMELVLMEYGEHELPHHKPGGRYTFAVSPAHRSYQWYMLWLCRCAVQHV